MVHTDLLDAADLGQVLQVGNALRLSHPLWLAFQE
jgi:hypothetical protein